MQSGKAPTSSLRRGELLQVIWSASTAAIVFTLKVAMIQTQVTLVLLSMRLQTDHLPTLFVLLAVGFCALEAFDLVARQSATKG